MASLKFQERSLGVPSAPTAPGSIGMESSGGVARGAADGPGAKARPSIARGRPSAPPLQPLEAQHVPEDEGLSALTLEPHRIGPVEGAGVVVDHALVRAGPLEHRREAAVAAGGEGEHEGETVLAR